jgi:hypothetical protein
LLKHFEQVVLNQLEEETKENTAVVDTEDIAEIADICLGKSSMEGI